ncbi:MAG TPA: DinB family protein [Anaerolineales bacterium]
MEKADVTGILEYNYWANRRILAAASKISLTQFVASTAFPHRSLRGTLVHLIDAEFGWRTQMKHARQTDRWVAPELSENDLPTLESVVKRAREEEAAMRAFLAGLNDESMTEIVRYITDEGIKRERLLWHCLYHVVNHGSQHRSEAAAMLTDYGQSPGDLDFTLFLNETAQHPT